MQIVLEQTFLLGRFHATPWKTYPYEDPHGEWPPSPWRLVRAVLARSYQMDREVAGSSADHANLRESMVGAFAASDISWQLPPSTWRGPGFRQYHPAEFRRVPASAKEPGMMAYNTTKVLDNFWVTPSDSVCPLVWMFEGAHWNAPMLAHLDACLARMTYFGRAESITEIRRVKDARIDAASITRLLPCRSGSAVPVLTLRRDASLPQIEASTDAPEVAATNIPPGSRWMYAVRPQRPRIRSGSRQRPELPPTSLIQFAIGSKIAPRYKDAVLITERFRNRSLGCFTKLFTGNPKSKWSDAPESVREKALLLSGKNPDGSPSKEHRHASFLLCGTSDAPSRLCIWRNEAFNDLEQRAILDAANMPLPLCYRNDPWTLNLVPLDKLVPAPPGLDQTTGREWISLTPFVPPRHVFGRSGREKSGCSVLEQLVDELKNRAFNVDGLIASVEEGFWVKIHRIKAERDARTNNDKFGYKLKINFREPVKGPVSIGASSHFGLGLFQPI